MDQVPQPSRDDQAADLARLVEQGEKLRDRGQLDAAETVFAEAMARFPDSEWAATHYADTALRRRDWEEALRRWEAVTDRFPDHAVGYAGKAAALIEVGRLDDAEGFLAGAAARFPTDPAIASRLQALCERRASGIAAEAAPPVWQSYRVTNMLRCSDVLGQRFRYSRPDGGVIANAITLERDGSISGYDHPNERAWAVEDGLLVFKDGAGAATTVFNDFILERQGSRLVGRFVPLGKDNFHMLTETGEPARVAVIPQLLSELYSGDGPLAYADRNYADAAPPATSLAEGLIAGVLKVVWPLFWLDLGAGFGGSAIGFADAAKRLATGTDVVSIDTFTGDADMWAWERNATASGGNRFLRLRRGRPTLYDRFLANVALAGHSEAVLPIVATRSDGLRLIRRLLDDHRIAARPEVISCDGAGAPEEIALERRQHRFESGWGRQRFSHFSIYGATGVPDVSRLRCANGANPVRTRQERPRS